MNRDLNCLSTRSAWDNARQNRWTASESYGRGVIVERERNGDGQLVRLFVDVNQNAKPRQFLHEARIERRDALRFERESSLAAIGRRDNEPMIHEIKIDVERSPADTELATWSGRGP